MARLLKPEFFNRSAVVVARDLIGKYLVRKIDGKIHRFKIVETESYEGFSDKASHAYRGQTKRNTPMFEQPATIYIYFTYGMHWMLNIVCGPLGHPAAVLIRGVEGVSGPARLTKKLSIDKMLNGKKLGKSSGLWIVDEHTNIRIGNLRMATNKKDKILATPRIGIDSSGPIWSKKLHRFVLQSPTKKSSKPKGLWYSSNTRPWHG